ncbi:MAG TPA: hypothetical protein EYG03_04370 [Planctomycetes bacterium]|nr:hypothetical protein [Fuerstiella sp.]HIK91214.1 hypothetical protein [Planctomycetota bacterium]
MTNFVLRRIIGVVIVAVLTLLLLVATRTMESALLSPRTWLGWLLVVIVLFLASYRVRKQFSMLPLGSSAGWLQCHIYVGLLSLPVFLLHSGAQWPGGLIEVMTGLLFLIVFCTGVVGLILTRTIPPRLTDRGEEVIRERIPVFIRILREEAEAAVAGAKDEAPSEVLSELYLRRLHSFFQRPTNFFSHVIHSAKPRTGLLSALADTRRFLNTQDEQTMERLAECVRRKDDLDYQYTMQSLLKYWLFLHVPLTWAMIVFASCHVVTAMAYTSQ